MTTKLILYKINPKADITSIIVDVNELPWDAVIDRLERHEPGSSRQARIVEVKSTKKAD